MSQDITTNVPRISASLSPALRGALVTLAFIAVGIAVPEMVGSALLMSLLVQAAISGVMAMAVGTLLRLNGLVSFGHAAFFGFAVYVVAICLKREWMGLELAILLALILPTLVAFLLGLVIVGFQGIAFSMMTLAVGQALYEFVMKATEVTGGDDGMSISLPSQVLGLSISFFQRPQTMFIVCWVILILLIYGLFLLTHSPFGRLVEAIRENEERARFIGYRTKLPRAIVFALSALIAALGGVLFALYNGFAPPDTVHWSTSGSALIMVIIGGPKLLWGPAFGAIIFFFFKDVAGNLTEHWQAIIGLTLILVTVLVPLGIGGVVEQQINRLRGKVAD